MAEAPGAGGGLHRLHPATTIVEIPRSLKALVLPLLAIFFASSAEKSARNFLVLGGIGAGLSVIGAVARYASTRFGIVGDRLVIRSGILFRNLRSIPLRSVQNIDLQRSVVHRLFGVTEVRVETAGAAGSEAHLKVVAEDDARLFRSELLARRARLGAADEAGAAAGGARRAEGGEVLRRSRLWELAVAGATENRAGVIIGALFGLQELSGLDLDEAIGRVIETASGELGGLGAAGKVAAAAAAIVLLVFLGWLVSITLTITRHYGFTLTRRGRQLRCRYGLLTTVEAVVPLPRLQLLRLQANPLHRLLSMATLTAETAGSAREGKSGAQVLLTPLAPRADAVSLCRAVLAGLDPLATPLRPVHRRAVRRGLLRYAVLGLAVLVGPAAYLGGWWWTLPAAWLPLAALLARLRYAALGWTRRDGHLIARAGIWTRRLWIVPEAKVQSVSATSSPFQRRLGLATLHVDTAGGNALSHARVVDLAASDAEALREDLARASNSSGLRRGGI